MVRWSNSGTGQDFCLICVIFKVYNLQTKIFINYIPYFNKYTIKSTFY
jgi:hypothetical protein